MELSNTGAEDIGKNSGENTSLGLATTLSFVSFSLAFVDIWKAQFGSHTLPRIATVFEYPDALSSLIAQSFGASLLLPTVHVAIASFFKSKRNSNSRRRIYIGWSLVVILVLSLTLLTSSKVF